ncbi:Fc receptor-like protein 5 [Cetorhinus maximus]
MPVYGLNAILQMAATSSLLLTMAFAVQRSVPQSPPSNPVISLDQQTGVYIIGERVTISCTVTGDDRDKTFHFYRGDQILSPSQLITKNNIGTAHVTAVLNGEQYSCAYNVSVNGRRIDSPLSQHVMVTITAKLSKPVIRLNEWTGVYVVGERVTITCSVTGDYQDKIFHFYRGDQELSLSQVITKNNIGTVHVTAGTDGEEYSCAYNVSVNGRRIDSPLSEHVLVTITAPPSNPVIRLDQQTGVYVVGERVTITCTVTGDDRNKTFHFYRGDKILSLSQLITKNNIGTVHVTAGTSGEKYSCAYSVSVNGRRIDSPVSQHMMVTITDRLRKPWINLNQWTGVYVIGETVTMTCAVTGDDRAKTFSFYKDAALQNPWEIETKGNMGTFPDAVESSEGLYQCEYAISIRGRHLTSPKSEAMTLTTTDPQKMPVISLDETTGVYAVGETITMTCTVTGDNREKRFHFYKGHQQLPSSPIITNTNTLTFPNTSLSHSGQYQCQYRVTVQSRQFDSKKSQAVTVIIAAPPIKPVITFNKPTGVYLPGEMGNITCTVTGDMCDKTFQIFRNNEEIHITRTQDSFVRFSFRAEHRGGQYQCRYGIYINNRWLVSPDSESVTVTIATLPKPNISVDSSAVVRGGALTFNCTSPGDNPAIAFYLHRQGDANHNGAKSAVSGINSVTFTIRNVDHSEMGNYTCRYEALTDGKNLYSALSDPVYITVTEKKPVALAACVGSAVGLILILVLLGVCFWRKGKTASISETRNVVPSGDQINETITYAVLIQQTNPKRDRQRDTGQAQREERTIYAEVKL